MCLTKNDGNKNEVFLQALKFVCGWVRALQNFIFTIPVKLHFRFIITKLRYE